jgi:hypothetical protein
LRHLLEDELLDDARQLEDSIAEAHQHLILDRRCVVEIQTDEDRLSWRMTLKP